MKKIKIRKITLDDLDQLEAIGRITFVETYSSQNSEQNIKEYLDKEFSSYQLKKELNNPNSEFFSAELKHRTIGYLKVNFGNSQTEILDGTTLEIERIYVLKEFQGQNIGQMLYEKAITVAKQKMVDYVWLGVWERNQKAIKFYHKNGFTAFDKHIFKLGNEQQTDIMMRLKP